MEDAQSRSPKSVQKWVRRGVGVLAVGAAVAAVAVMVRPEPAAIDVVLVTRGPMNVRVNADGVTRIKDRYVLSAPTYGQMARVTLRPGDAVTAGDELTTITSAPPALLDVRARSETESRIASAQAALRQAQEGERLAGAALEFAERELERLEALSARGIAADSDLAAAEFSVRSREADAASAEFSTRIARHQVAMVTATLNPETGDDGTALAVTTPVDGVVLRVLNESGGIVQPGSPIVEIGDASALEVVVDVLTTDAVGIPVGAPVVIERWGGEAELAGHVRNIEPQAFTRLSALGVEEQRVNVVIDLDSERAQWERLGDGWRVEAGVLVWSAPDVAQVPLSAVFRSGGSWAAYRVRDGVVELVPIELGQRDGRMAEVLAGLGQGDAVVAYPSDTVEVGAQVVARVLPSAEGSGG